VLRGADSLGEIGGVLWTDLADELRGLGTDPLRSAAAAGEAEALAMLGDRQGSGSGRSRDPREVAIGDPQLDG
jgi:hypothetical protein